MAKQRRTSRKKSLNKVEKIRSKPNYSYTNDDLKDALEEIRLGGASKRSISKKYQIPRTTLICKSNGQRPSTRCRRGPQCVLGNDVEQVIVKSLMENVEKGVPISTSTLKSSVKKIVEEIGIKNLPFKDNTPGRKWVKSFKERHPEITGQRSEFINQDGARRVDDTSIPLNPKPEFVSCEEIHKDIFDDTETSEITEQRSEFTNQGGASVDDAFIPLNPKLELIFSEEIQNDICDNTGTSSEEVTTKEKEEKASVKEDPLEAKAEIKQVETNLLSGEESSESAKNVKKLEPIENEENACDVSAWHCYICELEGEAGTRCCFNCMEYVHGYCAGLPKKNKEAYVCPNCSR